ncbi:hypothetical protein I553_3042 [Mycobacterium xenopi 4042]|uniref:Uncharacterized protein n=1 Tax=Mycobacterium xenopi 4042 TaxID=1299334 RepID=X8BM06_MYCXE|nr:hypothetical protein I553_3042 [Mycobacterium xenopi 4042]
MAIVAVLKTGPHTCRSNRAADGADRVHPRRRRAGGRDHHH